MKNLGVFVAARALGIPLAAWMSWVMIQLWLWFVTPTFGLEPPGLWTVAGLIIFVRMTHTWGVKTLYDDLDDVADRLLGAVILGIVVPATGLASGFVFHLLTTL